MELYVLKYKNGKYVQRDDSTGPMSTGGYPQPVGALEEATFFPTAEAAAAYAQTSEWRDLDHKVYKLGFHLLGGIDYSPTWVECNHHCVVTMASTNPVAKHFLDCPVWKRAGHLT